MTETSTCYAFTCGTVVEGKVDQCPKCGKVMRGSDTIRRSGWLLLIIGLFLVAFMGAIAWSMAPALMNPGHEVSGDTFEGTAAQGRMIFALFGAVMVFGIGTALNGVIQIATGRRNRWLSFATLILAAAMLVLAVVTTEVLG